MNNLSSEKIYRAFRDLLDESPPALRPEIKRLLTRAKKGEKTDNQLLRLARREPLLLQQVNARLEMRDRERGYSSLAGQLGSAPGLTYVCPQCDYLRLLGEVGEDPGECPLHHVALIPKEQKGR